MTNNHSVKDHLPTLTDLPFQAVWDLTYVKGGPGINIKVIAPTENLLTDHILFEKNVAIVDFRTGAEDFVSLKQDLLYAYENDLLPYVLPNNDPTGSKSEDLPPEDIDALATFRDLVSKWAIGTSKQAEEAMEDIHDLISPNAEKKSLVESFQRVLKCNLSESDEQIFTATLLSTTLQKLLKL